MHVFYLADLPPGGGDVSADADERKHIRIRRLKTGEPVRLVDGRGGYAEAEFVGGDVFRAGPSRVEAPDSVGLKLLQARLPAEKLDWAIQKAVELGVDHVVVFHPERSGLGKQRPDRPLGADRQRSLQAVRACALSPGRDVRFPRNGDAASGGHPVLSR